MRSALRPAHLYLLLTYLALSAVPFVPMLLGKSLARPWQVLGIEVSPGWASGPCLNARRGCTGCCCRPSWRCRPSSTLLSFTARASPPTTWASSPRPARSESIEFLGQKFWLMVVSWLPYHLVGLGWRAARRRANWTGTTARAGSRWPQLAVGGHLAWTAFGVAASRACPGSASARRRPGRRSRLAFDRAAARNGAARRRPPGTAPCRRPLARALACRRFDALRLLAFRPGVPRHRLLQGAPLPGRPRRAQQQFTFGAHQAAADNAPEMVVMVIGESSRYDRWSLNGYARDTNPLLSQEANLVALPDSSRRCRRRACRCR